MSDQRKPSTESGFRLAGALYGAEQAALQAIAAGDLKGVLADYTSRLVAQAAVRR